MPRATVFRVSSNYNVIIQNNYQNFNNELTSKKATFIATPVPNCSNLFTVFMDRGNFVKAEIRHLKDAQNYLTFSSPHASLVSDLDFIADTYDPSPRNLMSIIQKKTTKTVYESFEVKLIMPCSIC